MFRDKLNKFLNQKDSNEQGNNKKKIENLVFFIVILIITIIVINIIWNGDKSKDVKQENTSSKQLAKSTGNETVETSSQAKGELETELEEILSKIQGVGEVNVFINYSESSEVIPMYNENAKTAKNWQKR